MAEFTTVATGKVWLPGAEFVTVKGTNGDTYKSTKFKVIEGVVATPKSSTTTDSVQATWTTDNTVTIACSNAATNQVVSLIIFGKRF